MQQIKMGVGDISEQNKLICETNKKGVGVRSK